MRNETDFRVLVGFFYNSSAAISIVLNIFSIYLALTKSPKSLGAYKHLMVIISVYEIFYSMLDAFLVPIHFSHGPAIVELVSISDKPVGRRALVFLNLIYWIFFGASLTILSLHFIYRWFVVSKNPLLASFHSWKLALWLLIPFVMGLIWMADGYFLCSPNRQTSDYVSNGIRETLGRSIDDFEYFGVHVYERRPDGSVEVHYRSVVGLAIMLLTIGCSLTVIVYFGVKCYRRIASIMQMSSSSHHQSLQTQLFHALVAQTLVPIFLVHLPTAVLLLFAFLNVDLGSKSVLVSLSVALYPSVESLPNLFIIKSYREAIFGSFRRFLSSFPCTRKTTSGEPKMTIELFHTNSYLIRINP